MSLEKIKDEDLQFNSIPLGEEFIDVGELGNIGNYAPSGANAYRSIPSEIPKGYRGLVKIEFYKLPDE